MGISSYYGRSKAQGSTQKVMLNLGEGLNEFLPPMSIRDGQLSACKNFYSPDGTSLQTVIQIDPVEAVIVPTGNMIHYGISDTSPSIFVDNTAGTLKYFSFAGNNVDISSYGLYGETYMDVIPWAKQAADYYYYFPVAENAFISAMKLTPTSFAITKIDIPFNFKSGALYSYRLFALDDKNTLWWSAGGNEYSWYGSTPDNQYVAEDAGYWYIPDIDVMQAIVAFRDGLYIFGAENIWLFSGYSPETFALTKVVSGIGLGQFNKDRFAEHDGLLYFSDGSKVYAYNGNSIPTIISEPIISNGSVINGTTCGIKPTTGYMSTVEYPVSMASDNNYLYLYDSYIWYNTNTLYNPILTNWIYIYDFARRTWFKRQGFKQLGTTYTIMEVFTAKNLQGNVQWAMNVKNGTNNIFYIDMAHPSTGYDGADYESFFVTKAFMNSPSSNQTVSGFYMTWQAIDELDTNMEVYVSDSAKQQSSDEMLADLDWDNFTRVYSMSSYVSNQQPQVVFIPMPSNFTTSNTPFFRIAVKVKGCQVVIYNMEIHYRIKGASR